MSYKFELFFKYCLYLLIIVPFAYFIYIVRSFTLNIPYFDDFHWCNGFLADYSSYPTFLSRFNHIFVQDGPHLLIIQRFFYATVFEIFGSINYKYVVFFGLIFFLIIWLILLKVFFYKYKSLIISIVVSFLFLQVQYYLNVITSFSIPNIGVLAFALICYYCCIVNLKYFHLGLVFGFLAIFTNSNGIFVLPALITVYLIQNKIRTKEFYIILIYFMSGIFCFLILYEKSYLSIIHTENLVLSFVDFMFCALLEDNPVYCRILGAFIAIVLTLIILKNYFNNSLDSRDYFIICLLLFICLTDFTTTLYRTYVGIQPNWYKEYSILFIIVAFYFFLKINIPKYFITTIFLIFSIFSWAKSIDYNISNIKNVKIGLLADSMNFYEMQEIPSIPSFIGAKQYFRIQKATNLLTKKNTINIEKFNFNIKNTLSNNLKIKNSNESNDFFQIFDIEKKVGSKLYFGVISKDDFYFYVPIIENYYGNKKLKVEKQFLQGSKITSGIYNVSLIYKDLKSNKFYFSKTKTKVKITNIY